MKRGGNVASKLLFGFILPLISFLYLLWRIDKVLDDYLARRREWKTDKFEECMDFASFKCVGLQYESECAHDWRVKCRSIHDPSYWKYKKAVMKLNRKIEERKKAKLELICDAAHLSQYDYELGYGYLHFIKFQHRDVARKHFGIRPTVSALLRKVDWLVDDTTANDITVVERKCGNTQSGTRWVRSNPGNSVSLNTLNEKWPGLALE